MDRTAQDRQSLTDHMGEIRMSDTFIQETRGFLAELAQNNNRVWWLAHKAQYDAQLKAPAETLLGQMQPKLADLSDLPVVSKLFRPHRDVRFSKDKTPYKTHLHMMWRVETGARQDCVFFFGIGLDYITAGAGMMGFEKDVLADWRQFLDLDTKRMLGILDGLENAGATFREPALKRVPPPYDKDHPAAKHLRRKGLIAHFELPPDGPLEPQLEKAFHALWPLNALLIQVAEA